MSLPSSIGSVDSGIERAKARSEAAAAQARRQSEANAQAGKRGTSAGTIGGVPDGPDRAHRQPAQARARSTATNPDRVAAFAAAGRDTGGGSQLISTVPRGKHLPLPAGWSDAPAAPTGRFIDGMPSVPEPGLLSVIAPSQGAGGAVNHPFQVTNASTGGVAKVSVRYGTVNSTVPTIGGVALNGATPPLLNVATGVVYLAAVFNVGGTVTSASVLNAASVPADDATHGYLTLASVTVAAGDVTVIDQAVTHSLGTRRCGVSTIHFWGV